MDVNKIIREKFHGFSDEQWDELKNTFPYSEIPFIVKRALENKANSENANCAIFDVTCRTSVDWFARNMELKLRENDHKGGWKKCEHSWLLDRLKQEVVELEKALDQVNNQENVIREAADVANFALMIADLAGRLYGR